MAGAAGAACARSANAAIAAGAIGLTTAASCPRTVAARRLHGAGGVQRAHAIGAWGQVGGDGAPLPRTQQKLYGDMLCLHWTRHAETAAGQWSHDGCRRKRQLDVALEVAVVVDVARRTVRAVGQLGQRREAVLGSAAVGAAQTPFHAEKPRLHT